MAVPSVAVHHPGFAPGAHLLASTAVVLLRLVFVADRAQSMTQDTDRAQAPSTAQSANQVQGQGRVRVRRSVGVLRDSASDIWLEVERIRTIITVIMVMDMDLTPVGEMDVRAVLGRREVWHRRVSLWLGSVLRSWGLGSYDKK